MLSKLPKPDTRATYTIPASGSLPELQFVLEAEVAGSDIRWNNLLGKITITAPSQGPAIFAACHLGQFTGNCGAKYIAHLQLNANRSAEERKKLLRIIESFAFHKTNCGFIVGSDTTKPYEGQTIKNIQAYGESYQRLPDVKNPNWHHDTALFWKDITHQENVNLWSGGKVEKLT